MVIFRSWVVAVCMPVQPPFTFSMCVDAIALKKDSSF